ncbi:outer membrane autotransporter protein [Ereboglobus sp. PH5-10]|uniref:autotransporter outer membrane beta-barrel domain-containing protein n=1 Tax=Ereboglobus sp. PH5-10 TaxID=2940629 RepID=UPI002405931D|nr:autotransporter outer membrane beta-barrel domain-containing protein [Ereboglobus sp. PH5-10]MDF9826147.1 outer membrane autotransporter protein [Ereboglobus sp. PH5-10]
MNTHANDDAVIQNGNGIQSLPLHSGSSGRRQISGFFKSKFIALASILSLFVIPAPLFSQSTESGGSFSGTPLLPTVNGTYYYEGYDAASDRYIYVAPFSGTDPVTEEIIHSGTYYYVDSAGNTTVGGEATYPVISPYRAVVESGSFTFQFHNAHAGLYSTAPTGTLGETGTTYAVRSGTWSVSDVTFTMDAADGSGLWAVGYTGTTIHPVTFTGTNVNVLSITATNSSRQAVSIRSGAEVYLYSSTVSKTYTNSGADGSETIYMVANQEGKGSSAYLYGKDLTLISSGRALEAINQGNGHTVVELYDSIISSTISAINANTQVFNLNDQQSQGGAHFYGENLTIDVTNTSPDVAIRTFAFGYGGNSITLKDSTVTTGGGKGAVFRWKTSEGTGGSAGGNEAMADGFTSKVFLENTNVTAHGDFAPIFQQTGRLGWAEVTGGTLTTTGTGSPIIRLAGANDAKDESKFTGIFTGVVMEAQQSSAIDLDMFIKNTTNYGEDGGGVGKEVTTLISSTWDLIFISSTLTGTSAVRLATAGADNSPYSTWANFYVYDSTINGCIEMLAGAQNTSSQETSGANLFVQGTNSVFTGGFYITGSNVARKTHQARFDLSDSTFTGDIIATDRGLSTFNFVRTPVTGNISLSGSTTTFLDLISSPISGGISLDGTATLQNRPGLDLNNRRATIHNSAIVGGFDLAGSSVVDLTFTGADSVVSGGITATGKATGVFRFEEDTSLNGGVTLSGSSSVAIVLSSVDQFTGDLVVLERATLALSTFANTDIYLNRGLTLGGIWRIPGKTTLEGLLNITDSLGSISIANAANNSLTLVSGLSGNGRLIIESIDSQALGASEIRVIHDETNTFASDALILAHPVDYGLAGYTLENRSDGAYLIGGLDNGSFGSGGAAVFNTQALAVEDWYAALAPVNQRLNQLRENNRGVLSGVDSPANGDSGSIWFQGRTDYTRVNLAGTSRDFTSRVFGLTVGADVRWDFDTGTVSSGIFADSARIDRDFINTGDGHTTSAGGGLYFHYQHRSGAFVSGIARFDVYENNLNTNSPTNELSANYHTQALGAVFDFGWRFNLGEDETGWWFEPAYQIGFASLPGVSYTTKSTRADNIIDIEIDDVRATQNVFRFAFGKTLGKNWSFRGHVLAATIDASGGEFKSVTGSPVYTIAEDRAEVSLGVSWRAGRAGRINLDVAYTEADDYDRPYSVFLGYSHLW